jgi:hypothetical protein
MLTARNTSSTKQSQSYSSSAEVGTPQNKGLTAAKTPARPPRPRGEANGRGHQSYSMAPSSVPLPTGIARLRRIGITEAAAKKLSSSALVDRLVASGISRLSAERIVAIERGAEPGRARNHSKARR